MNMLFKKYMILGLFLSPILAEDIKPVVGPILAPSAPAQVGPASKDADLKSAGALLKALRDFVVAASAIETSRGAITDALTFNLCKINVEGSELFCKKNLGIERIKMPQLIGSPIAGKEAANLVKAGKLKLDKNEVNLGDLFKEYLKKKYTIETKTVPASSLMATQNELVGSKVAGMYNALKLVDEGKLDAVKVAGITAPIFVSNDNYILDGHHRWAAIVAKDLDKGKLGEVMMTVDQIQVPMKQLLKDTDDFLNIYGIESKAG